MFVIHFVKIVNDRIRVRCRVLPLSRLVDTNFMLDIHSRWTKLNFFEKLEN